jgi:hypothetical protein
MDDPFDLGPQEPGPGFPVHTITVIHVEYEEPVDRWSNEPEVLDYRIDHGECTQRAEECIVESIVTDIGVHAALFGVWDKDNRLTARDYRVQGWASVSPATPNGPEEYDAGIEWVDDEEIPFKSDGSFGLPTEGVLVIKHMPDPEPEV